jgi:serine/threonine-protein kinase RsbT
MTLETRARREMKIASEDDVIVVRRAVRALAEAHHFDVFACAAITTATSELTRNVWVHARGGVAVVEEIYNDERMGIRVTFRDDGPGIADVERVLAGGFSTAKSMGLGLSGSRRLVDEFRLDSAPGRGTWIQIVKWQSP